MRATINRDRGDSREGQLEVIGFDAANIVWSGCIQCLHQHLQRVTKLWERHHHPFFSYTRLLACSKICLSWLLVPSHAVLLSTKREKLLIIYAFLIHLILSFFQGSGYIINKSVGWYSPVRNGFHVIFPCVIKLGCKYLPWSLGVGVQGCDGFMLHTVLCMVCNIHVTYCISASVSALRVSSNLAADGLLVLLDVCFSSALYRFDTEAGSTSCSRDLASRADGFLIITEQLHQKVKLGTAVH